MKRIVTSSPSSGAARVQGMPATASKSVSSSAKQRFMVYFLPVSNEKRADACPPVPLFYHNSVFRESPQQRVHGARDGERLAGGPDGVGHVLEAVAVTTLTTVSSSPSSPCSHSFFTPAVPVTPAGSPKTPQVLPRSCWASMISRSETFTARPPDSRMAARAFSPFRGTPTAMESAKVFSSMGFQSPPSATAG